MQPDPEYIMLDLPDGMPPVCCAVRRSLKAKRFFLRVIPHPFSDGIRRGTSGPRGIAPGSGARRRIVAASQAVLLSANAFADATERRFGITS